MNPKNLIENFSHRPWDLPASRWIFYQEWNNSLFLHWKISADELKFLIPKGLILDTFEGEAWISLVAFTMEKIRPRALPALSFISNFHEINIRTYVSKNNKPGVYFLNIEAEKLLSTFIAKNLSGLPYEKSDIIRDQNNLSKFYISSNLKKQTKFEADFTIIDTISNKSKLDRWLTERYCLYFVQRNELYRYEIHHQEWGLKNVQLKHLVTDYKVGHFSFDTAPNLVHYSEGVNVLAWPKEKIIS